MHTSVQAIQHIFPTLVPVHSHNRQYIESYDVSGTSIEIDIVDDNNGGTIFCVTYFSVDDPTEYSQWSMDASNVQEIIRSCGELLVQAI